MNRTWDSPFRYIVMTIVLILFVALLWYIREIFRPLIAAGLLAYFLSPAVQFIMSHFKLRRKTAATIVYVATIVGLILFFIIIIPITASQIAGITDDFQTSLNQLEVLLRSPLQYGNLNLDMSLLVPALRSLILGGSIVPQFQGVLQFLQVTSRGLLWTLLIFVTTYYLMTEWDILRAWLIRLAPANDQNDLAQLYARIRQIWMNYLRGQLRLIAILTVLYTVVWLAIGLPGALPLGFLAGLLNLLPEVGPATIAILAMLVAFLEGSTLFVHMPVVWFTALTLGTYLLINTFKTVYLQPRILGQSVFLHEGLVFIAIVAAVVLQGVLGVLIVVPLLATIAVVGKYIRCRLLGLHPFDDEEPASPPDPEPDASAKNQSSPKQNPARKKSK
jgi:predicted PurR-regulated permease PerM